MWIIPKQLEQLVSSRDTVELNEVLSWQESESITLHLVRSKPMPKRTLLQRWKKGHFLRTLYGRMLRPSLHQSFVESWISSLEDSPANHSAQQAQEMPMKTQDTSSLPASNLLRGQDPVESSLKTSKDSLVQNLEETIGQTPKGRLYSSMCLESWRDEVTKQRGEYSQRLKQAHHTREKESSSLGNWPTPSATMHKRDGSLEYHQREMKKGNQLALTNVVPLHEAKNWPTPNTMDSIAPKSQEALDRNRKKGGCANLREWIHHEGTYQYPNWPSPIVRDHMDNYGIHLKNRKDGKKRDDTLPRKVYGQHDLDNGNSPLNSLELNPNWVEQLMGLPPGLTDLGSWGMESSHKPQPSPGELLTRDFEWEENLLKMASS